MRIYMDRKSTSRLIMSLIILICILPTGQALLNEQNSNKADRWEDMTATAEKPNNITVITTSPRASADASIIAIGKGGQVIYYNESHSKYFDVDPVPSKKKTVEYIAEVDLSDSTCPPTTTICNKVVVEQVNLSTGETQNIVSIPAERRNDWHDVDRLGPQRLLFADINNRIFILNTTNNIITWEFEFRHIWDRSSGGVYPSDWTHLNDVEKISDEMIMASPRNHDKVVFIHQSKGIMYNRTLGEDDNHSILYEQHNPDYIPSNKGGPSILVADSENNRVVEYQRINSSWVQTWQWSTDRTAWPRDADRLPNGNTLITESNSNRIVEIDQQGSIVWSITVDTPYEAERLQTGGESSGGASAKRLNLDSRGSSSERLSDTSNATGKVNNASERGQQPQQWNLRNTFQAIFGLFEIVIPQVILNGALFMLPPWLKIVDIGLLMFAVVILSVWIGFEFYLRGYHIQLPLSRK